MPDESQPSLTTSYRGRLDRFPPRAMDEDEETTPVAVILATFASIALAAISWTYGVVWGVVVGVGGLLVSVLTSLDPGFILDATKSAIQTVAGVLLGLLTLPYSIIVALVVPVFDFLVFIFSPIIYPVWWILSWHEFVLWFLYELKPLYTFFGTAVLIGIITGLFLWRVSIIIGLILGWQGEEEEEREAEAARSEDLGSDDGETTPRKAVTCTPADSQASGDSPQLGGVGKGKIEVKKEGDDVKDSVLRLV